VAASNLPGFIQTAPNSQIFYKSWSAVTINLLGYSGKTMRLEFTTNDCSRGGHFGYAYLDINQNCTSPLSGNIYCGNATGAVTLVAPPGFQAYHWFKDGDFTKEVGTLDNLLINPAPPLGTQYAVRIVPYPGIGCEDTVYTTIKQTEPLNLIIKDTITVCNAVGIDITDSTIVAGSNPDFTYTYYEDAACTNDLVGPQNVSVSGTYYIKATTPGGCSIVKPIHVNIFSQAGLIVTNPPLTCRPSVVDITDSAVTKRSAPGSTLTYWKDLAATQPLSNPKTIDTAGTYYIKASALNACSIIRPVVVTIVDAPKLVITDIAACTQISIRAPSATAGSGTGLTLSYWLDSLATQPVLNKDSITSSGKFYIQAVNANGCSVIAPINLTVNPVPVAVITDPQPVVFPETVDMSSTFTPQPGLSYTYWRDANAIIPLANATKVTRQSTYYIKVANPGCSIIYPVHVIISKPPDIDFSINVFTPNGDGTNDFFKFKAPLSVKLKSFKIYTSWGQLIFETTDINKAWDGKFADKPMPQGSYYWIFEAYDTYSNTSYVKSGNINILR
jgi:gliding motility-associated-like protein